MYGRISFNLTLYAWIITNLIFFSESRHRHDDKSDSRLKVMKMKYSKFVDHIYIRTQNIEFTIENGNVKQEFMPAGHSIRFLSHIEIDQRAGRIMSFWLNYTNACSMGNWQKIDREKERNMPACLPAACLYVCPIFKLYWLIELLYSFAIHQCKMCANWS